MQKIPPSKFALSQECSIGFHSFIGARLDLVIGLTNKAHDGNPQTFAQNHRLGKAAAMQRGEMA